MKILISSIISYFLGSISLAYILGKKNNIDIREHGSGNPGSTNVLRVLGKKYAALTFLFDFSKGVLALFIAQIIGGNLAVLNSAIWVVIGHNYPLLLKFKGGKGVATSLGIIYFLNWKVGIIISLIAFMIVLLTKYMSLASIIASISAPIIMNLLFFVDKKTNITMGILVFFIIIRHRENIRRLIKGTENKINLSRREKYE